LNITFGNRPTERTRTRTTAAKPARKIGGLMAATTDMTPACAQTAARLRPEQLAERIRDWQMACQPYIKQKVRIYGFVMPTYTIDADGNITVDYEFDAHLQTMLDQCDEVIDYLRQAHGLPAAHPPIEG
jgi:hypothetical protein